MSVVRQETPRRHDGMTDGETAVGRRRLANTVREVPRRVLHLKETVPSAALIALVLIVGGTHSRFFQSGAVNANILAASFVGIVGCGMVFLLAMGEIDLSIGGTYGICFYVAAKLASAGHNVYLAALTAIVVGMLLGAINGALVRAFKAPTIIVTLGTFSLYAGLVAVVSDGKSTGSLPLTSSFFTRIGSTWLGLPVAGWVALFTCAVLTLILMRSRIGAMVRATGSNRSAAAFSGIPIQRLQTLALMLTGGLAGLSAVLTLAYAQGGGPSIGTGLELQVIAAAIIGGTAISGGEGSVPGALIGAAIVVTVNSGLVFFDINPLWSNVVTGAVILIAVGSTAIYATRRRGTTRSRAT